MKNEFRCELKSLKGSILTIGTFAEEIEEELEKNTKITEVYYLNSITKKGGDECDNDQDIASDIKIAHIHKYFKKGIDNILCNYDEIKKDIPAFVRESLRITKKDIYILLPKNIESEDLIKKYKRLNLEYSIIKEADYDLLVVNANDIIVSSFKELRYYIEDNLQKIYNKISDAI